MAIANPNAGTYVFISFVRATSHTASTPRPPSPLLSPRSDVRFGSMQGTDSSYKHCSTTNSPYARHRRTILQHHPPHQPLPVSVRALRFASTDADPQRCANQASFVVSLQYYSVPPPHHPLARMMAWLGMRQSTPIEGTNDKSQGLSRSQVCVYRLWSAAHGITTAAGRSWPPPTQRQPREPRRHTDTHALILSTLAPCPFHFVAMASLAVMFSRVRRTPTRTHTTT